MNTKEVLWERLRKPQFEAAAKAGAIVIIPVASMEQHGNHLPVNTDTNCCFTLAVESAKAIEDFPVLVLPPVWTGYSPHHLVHAGTISLKYHTFVELLTEVAASVHRHGFQKILFLNGHGGNTAAVASLRPKAMAEEGVSCVGLTFWEIPSVSDAMKKESETDKGFIGHAAEIETSLQLYLQPDLVVREAAEWVPGMWGDPAKASREKGERIFRAAVRGLIEVLRDYHSGRLEERLVWQKKVL